MPAPSGFDHVSTTKSNSTRSIAAHPSDKLDPSVTQRFHWRGQQNWSSCRFSLPWTTIW